MEILEWMILCEILVIKLCCHLCVCFNLCHQQISRIIDEDED